MCKKDYLISYEVRLETDIRLCIEEELTLDIEQSMADALKEWLAPIFSGRAHDLDMSFFALDDMDTLKYHWSEVIDASQKSFTLYIPRENYMHLAVVNIADNEYVSLSGTGRSSTMHLGLRPNDTLPSQPTAIYTARQPMEMAVDSAEKYNVHLYMVSCAVALVIDSLAVDVSKMDVLLSGAASGFDVLDSVYTFDHESLIRADKLTDQCYAVISMPSRSDATSIGPAQMCAATADAGIFWELRCYVTCPDSTVTETRLSVSEPLEAGTLEIIRVNLNDDGSLYPVDHPTVGAAVTLDWKEGSEHNIDI